MTQLKVRKKKNKFAWAAISGVTTVIFIGAAAPIIASSAILAPLFPTLVTAVSTETAIVAGVTGGVSITARVLEEKATKEDNNAQDAKVPQNRYENLDRALLINRIIPC